MQQQLPDLSKSTKVICESCNGEVFVERLLLRRISKFFIASDKDQIVPLPVIACASCGHINEEFKAKFPNDQEK